MKELMAEIHENAFGTLRRRDMTLRDWFAGQALSRIAETYRGVAFDPEGVARATYQFADAMLAARNNNTENKETA